MTAMNEYLSIPAVIVQCYLRFKLCCIIPFVLLHFQKDHIRLSVTTALSKFRPPVEPHRYEVRFIPVVSPRDDVERTMTRIVSM